MGDCPCTAHPGKQQAESAEFRDEPAQGHMAKAGHGSQDKPVVNKTVLYDQTF
jgi:hypothetical protein